MFIINLILVFCGIVLLLYAAVSCHKLNLEVYKNGLKKPRPLILILIYVFIFGYILFFGELVIHISSQNLGELLVSVVFFFGSIFVVLILNENRILILDLIKNSLNMARLNSELKNKNEALGEKTDKLKISEEKYKKRSVELEETLDDFYTNPLKIESNNKN